MWRRMEGKAPPPHDGNNIENAGVEVVLSTGMANSDANF
jgi:hypothetical protein